jgi:hypothetical protein
MELANSATDAGAPDATDAAAATALTGLSSEIALPHNDQHGQVQI